MSRTGTGSLGRTVGTVLVLGGLLCNRFTLEATLVLDGRIESGAALGVLYVSQAVAVGAGLYCIVRPPRWPWPSPGEWGLLLAGCVVALGVAEVAARFLPEFRPRPRVRVGEYENRTSRRFVADPHTGWRMHPDLDLEHQRFGFRTRYRSDAHGFRRGESPPASGEAPSRVVLVGDSFTFGSLVPFDQTWGARLDAALPGVAVRNLAMPGFGIDQMWMSVRHQALPLEPDLVIVAFIDNDFDRSLTAYRPVERLNKPTFVLRDGVPVPAGPADGPGGIVRWLEARSHLWTAGRRVVRNLSFRFPVSDWWRLNAAILRQIRAECERRGVPLLFVRLPLKDWRPFPLLRDAMERDGASYLDTVALGPPDRPVHFENDGHIDGRGHAWVAGLVEGWIDEHLPELTRGRSEP